VLAAVYRAVISEKFIISFPIDLELLALFDRKVKTKFVFRGGIAVQIRSMFSARFGYSRQPKTIWEGLTKMENVNFFTGGIGVFFSPVSFDAYLSQGVFGMTAGYRF
jgi:hypothetical protein